MSASGDVDVLTSTRLMELSGATYRQIDHWSRLGYLEVLPSDTWPDAPAGMPGSGYRRLFAASEVAVARCLTHMALGRWRARSDLIGHVRAHGLVGTFALDDHGVVVVDLDVIAGFYADE